MNDFEAHLVQSRWNFTSMNEMMLNPRQRPKSPPREERNSTGPILMLLSSSGQDQSSTFYLSKICFGIITQEIRVCCILRLTYDSLLAKEYVEGGQIFFPGIVGDRFTRILKTNYHPIRDSDSELIWILTVYHWLEFNEGVIVLLSVGVGQPLDVIRQWGSVLSMINLFHLCKYTCWSNNN